MCDVFEMHVIVWFAFDDLNIVFGYEYDNGTAQSSCLVNHVVSQSLYVSGHSRTVYKSPAQFVFGKEGVKS